MNSTVSHEMRNPLNALLSSVEIQEKHVDQLAAFVDSQGLTQSCERTFRSFQKSLNVSKSSCKLLKFNVEDILALPQIQQGKFTRNLSLVNLGDSLNEIVEIMDYQIREKQIDLKWKFCGFPTMGGHGPVVNCGDNQVLDTLIDEQRFQQILLNYYSNAIKFTPRSGHISILIQMIADVRTRQEKQTCLPDLLTKFYRTD